MEYIVNVRETEKAIVREFTPVRLTKEQRESILKDIKKAFLDLKIK